MIDFECTTICPTWECAKIPPWLGDYDDAELRGEEHERPLLRQAFLETADSVDSTGEFRRACQDGDAFRKLTVRRELNLSAWAMSEDWVDECMEWAQAHPGVGMPDMDFVFE